MMRPRTWLILTLVLGLAAGGLYWLHRRQTNRYGRELLGDAWAAESAGRYDEAEMRYLQAIGVAPKTVDAYIGLAAILRQMHRDEEADYWLQRLLVANPQSLAAHVAHGRAQLARGQLDMAESDAERARQIAPGDATTLALARDVNLARNRLDEARGQARSLVDRDPTNAKEYLALAEIALRSHNRAEAIGVLNEAIAKGAATPELRFALINLLLDDGQLAEAKKCLATENAAELSKPLGQYLDARIDMAQGDWIKAIGAWKAVEAEFSGSQRYARQIHFWLGECYGHSGDFESQAASYGKAITIDPAWSPPHVGMALALLRAGRVTDGMRAIEAVSAFPDLPHDFWIEGTRALLLANLRLPPDSRDWTAVEKALAKAEQADPHSVAASLLRADLLLATDRIANAEKLLNDCRENDPKQIEPWLRLASLAAQLGQGERAAKLLKDAETQLGDGLLLRLAKADCLPPQDLPAATAFLQQLAEAPVSWSDSDRVALWREVAWRSLALGDLTQAARLYAKVADKRPDDLAAGQQLFDIAAGRKDAATMKLRLAQIARIAEGSPLWHCDQALLLETLAETSPDPIRQCHEALEHLKQAAAQGPRLPQIPLLTAAAREREGNIEAAIDNYEKAVELGELKPATVRRLTQLLYQTQRYADADDILRRFDQARTTPKGLARILPAGIWQRREQENTLLEARRAAANSQDAWDHIWLGRQLAAGSRRAADEGRAAEAEQMRENARHSLHTAIDLAGSNPAAWIALVNFLVDAGQTDEARKAIAAAKEKIAPDKAALALARCYSALGDEAAAARCYGETLDRARDNAVVACAAAEFYLRRGKTAEAEAALGKSPRRQLARIAAQRGLGAADTGRVPRGTWRPS